MEGKIMNEEWRDIEGYEGIYQISSYGRARSFKFNKIKILKPIKNNQGYLSYILSINGNRKQYRAHRLVAKAFIPNTENKEEVNHIDGDKQNNNVLNLEWVTRSENQQHAWDNDLKPRLTGNKNGFYGKHHNETTRDKLSKMHNKAVINIDTGIIYESITIASKETGVSLSGISACCKGKLKKSGGYKWEYKKN